MKNHWLDKKQEEIASEEEKQEFLARLHAFMDGTLEDRLRLKVREELRASMEHEYLLKMREGMELCRLHLEHGFDEAYKICEAANKRAEAAEDELRALKLKLLIGG